MTIFMLDVCICPSLVYCATFYVRIVSTTTYFNADKFIFVWVENKITGAGNVRWNWKIMLHIGKFSCEESETNVNDSTITIWSLVNSDSSSDWSVCAAFLSRFSLFQLICEIIRNEQNWHPTQQLATVWVYMRQPARLQNDKINGLQARNSGNTVHDVVAKA